jgi:hypothetical protein
MQGQDNLNIADNSPKNDNIFQPKRTDTFWVLMRDREPPAFKKQIAKDFLFRVSMSTGREQVVRCHFELNDNYLFCYKVRLALSRKTRLPWWLS